MRIPRKNKVDFIYPRKNVSDIFHSLISEISEEKDCLTEVCLRSSLEPYLETLLPKSETEQKIFSVVFIDLDHFKRFNDKGGHPFGDEILKYVGSSLRLTFHDCACKIFRYGGDEFFLVFPDKTARETAQMVQRLRYNMLHRPVLFKGKFYKVTGSYGIASYPSDGITIEQLINKADMAQYISKSCGRNLITLASEISKRRFYKVFSMACLTIIYTGLFLLAQPVLGPAVKSAITFLGMQVATKFNSMDMIFLANGKVYQGVITHETYKSLTLKTTIKNKTVFVYLDKEIIVNKVYGKKTTSKMRFDKFKEVHPNPHSE